MKGSISGLIIGVFMMMIFTFLFLALPTYLPDLAGTNALMMLKMALLFMGVASIFLGALSK